MKRKILAVLLTVSLLVAFFIPATASAAVTISILHTNDMHSRVLEGKYDGMGLAKVKTLVEEYKALHSGVLLFDAGDAVHGQTFSTLEEGASMITVMNEVGYDLMVAGNHDFNYGYERLQELDAMADFNILAANVLDGSGNPILNEFQVFTVNGVTVGVFGLTTSETTYKTHPDNVAGLTFEDSVVTAQRMVDQLTGTVDVIVALAHLGIDDDSTDTSIRVAEEVDGIDVIIDGHSHTVLPEGMVVNGTLIAQTGEYDKNLGVVTITVVGNTVTASAALITKADAAETVPDPGIAAIIADIQANHEVILSEEVGRVPFELNGERAYVRTGETNLGNLVTTAMLEETGADCALTNGGGIRASIDPGYINKGEIITVLPFGNYIITKNVTGAVIKEALEHGSSSYPDASGKFPHVGGMTYTIDVSRPVGDRIVNITIGGEPIDFEMEYILATNDFMAAGGDGYEMLKVETVNEFDALDEVVIKYIQARGIIAPTRENRILVIDSGYSGPSTVPVVPSGDVYVVVAGDTLSAIAAANGTTWQAIYELNMGTITDPNMIHIGDQLMMP
ncbi:MAG: 5'-nucleotidase C-terminal domain-containing protein [Clostridiales bacterium]|nr:5'-nucleotidase C-terminal domain-containing protein [Clostridiales bacterium]